MKTSIIISVIVAAVVFGCHAPPPPPHKCQCGPYLWEHAIIHPDDTNKLWIVRLNYREEPKRW